MLILWINPIHFRNEAMKHYNLRIKSFSDCKHLYDFLLRPNILNRKLSSLVDVGVIRVLRMLILICMLILWMISHFEVINTMNPIYFGISAISKL